MRHDDITNFLARCLKEGHNDVEVEPPLLQLTRETFRHRSANTESDSQNVFLDTRVFYPHTPSYWNRNLPSLFKSFESARKCEYAERIIQVEHGSLTPLVFSSCSGIGFEATVVMKKLAGSLAMKWNEPYSRVVS